MRMGVDGGMFIVVVVELSKVRMGLKFSVKKEEKEN
jgi:hypothetical protein